MTKGKAVVLAAFTVWPFLYMILFMGTMFCMMALSLGPGSGKGLLGIVMIIFPLHVFTILEIFALLIFYIVYLFKTAVVPEDKKALWAVVLILGHMMAMPIFWYFYIWQPLTETEQPGQGPEGDVADRSL